MNKENQVCILRASITSTKPKATAYWNSSTQKKEERTAPSLSLSLSLTHTHTHKDTLADINKIKY